MPSLHSPPPHSPIGIREENELNDDGTLFTCRCDSAKAVTTLLSCLRNVSISNNAGAGPSISSIQEANSSLLTSTTDRRMTQGTSSGGNSRGSKIQFATVFCSEKGLTFQVYGVGRQSRATVEINAGLFSEYYVAEQRVLMDDGEEEIVRGGEFGINLTTVLECLCVLGTNSLDRIKLCLSYDTSDAIFKIELLEESSSSLSSINGGVTISNIAIPGMSLADEDDVLENDEFGHESGLDYAFRSHPIVARARIQSNFLRDSISELTDVAGAVSATVSISKIGLELATFGHTTECHIIIPYAGNHPEIFVSLEGVGTDGNDTHARSFPMHLLLASMRGLEIAKETCISLNSNGMIAVQHQIFDNVGNGEANYVDFIMPCLNAEEDEEDYDDNGGMIMTHISDTQTSQHINRVDFSPEESMYDPPSQIQHSPPRSSRRKTRTKSAENSDIDNKHTDKTEDSQYPVDRNLFGEVAKFTKNRNISAPNTRRRLENKSQEENDPESDSEVSFSSSEHDHYENSFDVTAGFGKSSKNETISSASPQLMYGDTHLDASDDEK